MPKRALALGAEEEEEEEEEEEGEGTGEERRGREGRRKEEEIVSRWETRVCGRCLRLRGF